MKDDKCLGCRTYFDQNDKLPIESMVIQFKNYHLPLKDNKPKWILLKTMTGFLNSKGGTIYIGVEDKEGVIQGLVISRKQQDEFKLFIKQLVERIRPAVDLVNKEEIVIQFVPVVLNKVFHDRYVIKIIVKQGDPSQTYHFAQKIQLEGKNNKIQEFELFHAFYRHNMGGIEQLGGEKLLEQIHRKSANPNQIANTFHKFCNPQPLKLQNPLTKIGFLGVKREQIRNRLETLLQNYLLKFDIEFQLIYDIENQVLLIELENANQFKQVNDDFKSKLSTLNQTSQQFTFTDKGIYLDFYLYKALSKIPIQAIEKKPQKIPEQSKQVPRQDKSPKSVPQQGAQIAPIQDQASDNLQDNDLKAQKEVKYVEKPIKGKKESTQKDVRDSQIQQQLQKGLVLTVTNINPAQMQNLIKYLKESISKKDFGIVYSIYTYSIELTFPNKQVLLEYYGLVQKYHYNALSKFGIGNNLVFGYSMRNIRITHYDRNKRKELKLYIQELLGNNLEEIEFKKSNNKYFLEMKMKTKQLACEWLDKLLANQDLKGFYIPGAEAGKASKLKVFIEIIFG